MKIISLHLFLFIATCGFAQVGVTPQVISSTGGDAIVGNIHLSFTVGEAITTTLGNNTAIVTQGFQQPFNDSLPFGGGGTSDSLSNLYNGITPNGDGFNDVWIIDGVDSMANNLVIIFNRWGQEVWRGENYNNRTVVWRGNNKANGELPSGTYFYTIQLERSSYKGWIELTR